MKIKFSLIISIGISEYWDTVFSFNRFLSVSIFFKMTSLKLKTPFLITCSLDHQNSRVFFVFKNSFYGWVFNIFYERIKIRKLRNIKILYNIPPKLWKSSAATFSVFIISPFPLKLILSNLLNSEGLTVFKEKT